MELLAYIAFGVAAALLVLWLTAQRQSKKLRATADGLQKRLKALQAEAGTTKELQTQLATQQARLNQQTLELQQTHTELERLRKAAETSADLQAGLHQQKEVMDMQQAKIKTLEEELAAAREHAQQASSASPAVSEAEHFQLKSELAQLKAAYQELQANLQRAATTPPAADPQELQRLKEELQRLEAAHEALKQSAAHRPATTDDHSTETGDGLDATREILVQQGKMATLGTLVAGVTHELNTPLGAITAAGESLQKIAPYLISEYPNHFNHLGDTERNAFLKFVELSAASNTAFSSREERQFKKVIADKLAAEQVPDADGVAKTLVKGGIVEGFEAFIPLLKHPLRDEIFEMVSTAVKLRQGVDNIQLAAKKMDRMVKGVRNYSHTSGDKQEPVNLKESLETVLTLYHNKLKYGVEVTKHYEEGINPVMGVADELIQVWTNLVNNASQAMNAEGALDIDLKRIGAGKVAITITDNGPGIPQEIQEKIFQPFFTTKPKGEGTGLGLDIVKRIVEKHGGSISLESQPGRTAFTVVLPEYTGTLQPSSPMEGGIVGHITPHA